MKSRMSFMFLLFCVCSFAGAAMASTTKSCEDLYSKAKDNCTKYICEEAGYSVDDCHEDGDFLVYLQECSYEEFGNLIEAYNIKNPSKKISCDYDDLEL